MGLGNRRAAARNASAKSKCVLCASFLACGFLNWSVGLGTSLPRQVLRTSHRRLVTSRRKLSHLLRAKERARRRSLVSAAPLLCGITPLIRIEDAALNTNGKRVRLFVYRYHRSSGTEIVSVYRPPLHLCRLSRSLKSRRLPVRALLLLS